MRALTEYYKNPCVVQPSVKPALSVHWAARAIGISSTNSSADDSKTTFCQREGLKLRTNSIRLFLISNSQWSIGHHRAHRLHILHKIIHFQVRIIQVVCTFWIAKQIEHSVDRLDGVAFIGWEFDVPWVGRVRCVHRMIYKKEREKVALVIIFTVSFCFVFFFRFSVGIWKWHIVIYFQSINHVPCYWLKIFKMWTMNECFWLANYNLYSTIGTSASEITTKNENYWQRRLCNSSSFILNFIHAA